MKLLQLLLVLLLLSCIHCFTIAARPAPSSISDDRKITMHFNNQQETPNGMERMERILHILINAVSPRSIIEMIPNALEMFSQ